MRILGNVDSSFWNGKRVFVTGHTGFKGSWLCIWLHHMGAVVTGYALAAPTAPSLFEQGGVAGVMEQSVIGDVADFGMLQKAMKIADPEIVIHMAAQPLVRKSYIDPVQTYMTNVMGTVHLMEAARTCPSVRAILNVTTDKSYENQEWHWGYREDDPLGGYDPYSSSKACSEMVTSAYRRSFYESEGVGLASARAGNVIGGGDWAEDRLIPDIIHALTIGEPVPVRHPEAIRPWQHVLEPLSGYLLLCQQLYQDGPSYSQAWNFGPRDTDAKPVEWIVKRMLERWPHPHPGYQVARQEGGHEASLLKLDCSKAMNELGWAPRWTLKKALDATMDWYIDYSRGQDLIKLCIKQISEYVSENV